MLSLKFSLGKTEKVKLQAVHTVKESIVERKFTEGESEEEVNTWTKESDRCLKEADERALTLRQLVEKNGRRKASGIR